MRGHAGSSGHNHGPDSSNQESVGLSCLGHVRDCRKVATCQCPQRERHPRICWKNWPFSVAQEVKMALALQSSNILYLKRPKTSKLNGKACLSRKNATSMERSKACGTGPSAKGSLNIFHHLKGRGVTISLWTVLADCAIATLQTSSWVQ